MVSWNFILEGSWKLGFLDPFVLGSETACLVNMSIIVNEKFFWFLNSNRGLRQGD